MTESERIEALQREVDELAARLATAHEQTAKSIANTDRAIAQTSEAIQQAQRYLQMYRDEVKRHEPQNDEGEKNAS